MARIAWRSVKNADHRAMAYLKLFRRNELHQTTPQTSLNRYPEIFSACRAYFAARPAPTVLSFGCATGEEAVSLTGYFPASQIYGLEINPRSLAICHARPPMPRLTFAVSNAANLRKYGRFDAIFCMAVLQRTPIKIDEEGIDDISGIYPFARFDEALVRLDQSLNPGGLLIVHHTQYRVRDASIFPRYEALDFDLVDRGTPGKFGPDGRRLVGEPDQPVIYIKRS